MNPFVDSLSRAIATDPSAGRSGSAVRPGAVTRRAQRGASLIVALVALVAMISAGFALFRSVDSANLASTNYQFLRSAEQNTDMAMNEALLAYLQSSPTPALNVMDRNTNQAGIAYFAIQQPQSADGVPQVLQALAAPTWGAAGPNASGWPGEQIDAQSRQMRRYVIERMCTAAGAATANTCRLYEYQFPRNCLNNCGTGTSEWLPFVRITVRIDGPKNATAYSQMFLRGD
jgi:Tfp pilus assembly protein PilX